MKAKWKLLYDHWAAPLARWPRIELAKTESHGGHDYHLRIIGRNGEIGFAGEVYVDSRAGGLRMGKRWADLLGLGLWERT